MNAQVSTLFQKLFSRKSFLNFSFLLSVVGLFAILTDYGFNQGSYFQRIIIGIYFSVIIIGTAAALLRFFDTPQRARHMLRVWIFDFGTVLFGLVAISIYAYVELSGSHIEQSEFLLNLSMLLTFIREFAEKKVNYKKSALSPPQLFIVSFLVVILFGAILLELPNSTNGGISFIDALFTSTSAVCVTGLIVVDTATHFTEFGQLIIVILIQIGGLGILTFASYLSYFFKGGASYGNHLTFGEMTNADRLGEVFKLLRRILIITFLIELTGAILIYFSIQESFFESHSDRIFFAIFHSVSSFCNAGFSTLSNGLYDGGIRYNYWFQLWIIGLFTFGGLGFPIVVNTIKWLRNWLRRTICKITGLTQKQSFQPWVLTLNSRITLITTAVLIILGSVLFFISEYNHSIAEHSSVFGKVVTALFGATTPRTAGFNTIDMTTMNMATVLIVIFLMWIGASPASTGGGIKTTTIAIAFMNIVSLARGKSRIELFRREIASSTVRRAFAMIVLSIVVIGIGLVLIAIAEPHIPMHKLLFECVSAFSTVGLSLGITYELSSFSKFVLITIMIIGRVNMFTIITAVVMKTKYTNYRYPSEEISIN